MDTGTNTEEAKKRQRTLNNEETVSGNLPQAIQDKGRSRDIVAKFAGVGERTLKKAEAIVEAAEQNPELYLYAPLAAHDISITVVFYNIIEY